jgi:hypothetical protein
MCKHGVSLHFTHSDTSTFLSALEWLLGEYVDWASGSGLGLVMDHMPESLIVDQPDEDVDFELGSVRAAVHSFVTVVVESFIKKFFAEVVDDVVIFIRFKGFILDFLSLQRCRFGSQTLNQHTNRHSTGKGVGVDNDVRGHAGLSEGHVNFGPQH